MESFLSLPERGGRPRSKGLTVLIDPGAPLRYFIDVVTSHARYIDHIKFGWCTALVTPDLSAKIRAAREQGIDCYFGGTLFEKALQQDRLDGFRNFCRLYGCTTVELSNGTIDLSNSAKASYITEFSREFRVFSEVGYKDMRKSQELPPSKWVEYIREDLTAGASHVITEARESGTGGICRENGELRYGLISDILDSGVDSSRLIFEAPNKILQTYFIHKLGPEVNLANIAMPDVIGLETLRLGLRFDTFGVTQSRKERERHEESKKHLPLGDSV